MTRLSLALVPATAVLAAGCGGSAASSQSVAPPAAPATATPVALTSSSSAPGRYGAPPVTGSATGSRSAATRVSLVTKHAKLGTILAAGPKRLTVYLFEADSRSRSACSGACAKVWPPVLSSSSPRLGTGVRAADVGSLARSDGTRQVTYKGHPLYFFARDQDAGDAYGAGIKSFGAAWYVLAANGKKIDNS